MEGFPSQPHEVPRGSVERREDNKTSLEKLHEVMTRMSSEVNDTVKEAYGVENLIDSSARLKIGAYARGVGGIYEAEDVVEDIRIVGWKDRYNSGADNPNVQDFFKKQYGIDGSPESVVEQYCKNKEASKSNQAEMAITALLHKMLKERFIVVRASTFDDYENGMDNLILDRETGAVICAFDEVLRNESDEQGVSKKLEKIKKNALKGGKEAKYGISLYEDTLVRSHLRNVPVFYLELKSKDLNALSNDLLDNFDKEPTTLEQSLFSHLVSSIGEQTAFLEKLPLPNVMKNKLRAFEGSLDVLMDFTMKN